MCLSLVMVDDQDIEKVIADPRLVWKLFAPDDPDIYEEARKASRKGFFAKLFTSTQRTESISIEARASTDLDKAWHGIHYLLTETAWEGNEPLNFLVQGGNVAGNA